LSTELTPYVEKGLSVEEATKLAKWIENGKHGLSKYRGDQFSEVYMLGYSCEEIQSWIPDYPIEVLLWARYYYEWDRLREEFKHAHINGAVERALSVRADGLRFVTELLHATHIKWRKELVAYLANPDSVKPPECLPNSLSQYGNLTEMLREMLGIGPVPKAGSVKEKEAGASPLVSIHMSQQDGKKADIVVQSGLPLVSDVKDAIMKDVKNAARNQRE